MSHVSNLQQARLLVVDDEPIVRTLLARWLSNAGYHCDTADCAEQAWEFLKSQPVDLVTLDISMPGESGLDLLDRIRVAWPDIQAIMLTAEGDAGKAIRALTAGAHGYLIKPVERLELLNQVQRALEKQRLIIDNREHTLHLESKVREQTRVIRTAYEETIHRLMKASLYRDEETGAHIRRTGWCSELLASAIGWDKEQIEQIRLAAPMHDIGKIAIPDAILCKPGKLTPEEYAVMQTHAQTGANLLTGSQSPVLRMAAAIAAGHHERWDGTGYPARLKGCDIPQAARIVSIVDVYDALTHDRIYRPALSEEAALKIMCEGRGTHFDPELFDVFMSLLPEMRIIAEAIVDDHDDDDHWHVPAKKVIQACKLELAPQGTPC